MLRPLGARRTVQRGATYRYREESRALRLSRYLSGRIDRVTGREDTQLIEWTWEAMESSAFDGIVLSDREYLVRSYHDALRAAVPVMTLEHAPSGGTLSEVNASMSRVRERPGDGLSRGRGRPARPGRGSATDGPPQARDG